MSIGDLVSGLVFGLYRVLYIMGYSLRMREGVVETIQWMYSHKCLSFLLIFVYFITDWNYLYCKSNDQVSVRNDRFAIIRTPQPQIIKRSSSSKDHEY